MAEIIKDGTGDNYSAKVDSNNRLHTKSVTETNFEDAVSMGNGYSYNTGIINLTSDNESAILYIKNNSDKIMHIQTSIVQIGKSTNGTTTDIVATSYFNPTGGTIISDASAAIVSNFNLSSSNQFAGDTYKGAEGKTLTGGVTLQDLFISPSREELISFLQLPKGQSIGLSFTPPSGNTSINVQWQVFFHEE